MKPISFLLLAGWLAVAAAGCAASRNDVRTTHDAVSERSEELRTEAAAWRTGEELVREETTEDAVSVPGGEVAAAVPLAALRDLPEGARFAARQGSLAVEARRCGDTLVIAARSDSLPRAVVRTVRTEIRRQSDSAGSRSSEYRAAADSLGRETRAETEAAPARTHGWRWFAAGAACCAAVFIGIRRRR